MNTNVLLACHLTLEIIVFFNPRCLDVVQRVVGIVPMVMDLLNSVKNLHHFYRALGGWPVPFKPYFSMNVTSKLDTTEFKKLMVSNQSSYFVDLHTDCGSFD